MHPESWTVLRSPGGLELAVLVASAYLFLFAWWLSRVLRRYLEGSARS